MPERAGTDLPCAARLAATLTADRVRELLPEAAGLPVTVHPRSNLRAVYVVGEWLLSRTLDIPEQYL